MRPRCLAHPLTASAKASDTSEVMDLMEELTVGPRATHCCPSGRQYSFAPTTLIGYRRAQTSKVIGSKRLARGPEETPHSAADPLREGREGKSRVGQECVRTC